LPITPISCQLPTLKYYPEATLSGTFYRFVDMSGSSSGDTGLCDNCRSVNFSGYFLPPGEGEASTKNAIGIVTYKEKSLGLGLDIQRRKDYCNFCLLVTSATDLVKDDAKITMASSLCGRNQESTGADLIPAYLIRITVAFKGRQAVRYIQLLADDAHLLGLARDFRARVPGETGVDMRQARKWLDLCRKEHGSLCSTLDGDVDGGTPPPQPSDLLAIDLVKMCICDMPQGAEYAALSYCWPRKAYLTLKQNTRGVLFEHGGLLANMDRLPGTVQDAIKCAKELPFQYLWIDALCIIQDDKEHKEKQLGQMDRVYSCASLTLVCAYPVDRNSEDPCSGFPGYKTHDRGRDRTLKTVKGLRMMVASSDVDNYLRTTRWNTRCW
jgi:hypothetical protein